MCGILGRVGNVCTFNDVRWQRAQEIQRHRGPDDSGSNYYSVDNWSVHLAHQRLAIIDLTLAGHQPMSRGDDNSVIIFNGEVYNYLELREELTTCGKIFRTQTDTEVVLAALDYWGIEKAIKKFNGMWAFAWLNLRKKRLWLCRDRVGKKPLYLYHNDTELLFASELKTLLFYASRKFSLNLQVIGEYLVQSLLNTSTNSFFNDINQVPAGSLVKVDLSSKSLNTKTVPYWEPPLICNHTSYNVDLVKNVHDIFFDSVRIRLRSDVPVGILLSGGIDSSSIAAAAYHLIGPNRELNLLSAVSNEPRFDEAPFIDLMSAHLNRPVTKIVLDLNSETAIHYLEKTTWYNDEPIGSFSNVAHYLLMQRAQEMGITVILSGQGADELLCGYRKYLGFYIQSLVYLGYIKKALKILYRFWRNGTIVNQFSFADAKRYLPQWISKAETDIRGEALCDFKPVQMGLPDSMSVRERQRLDLQKFSVPVLTHYEDRMSMAFSREIRLPFLDVRLIELLLPLPVDFKLRQGWTKYIFRKALEPYLPPEIVWRKDKQGFINPQSEWLKNKLRPAVLAHFSEDSLIFKYRLVDRSALLKKYDAFCCQPPEKDRISFKDIFNPLALEIWLRRYKPWITRA